MPGNQERQRVSTKEKTLEGDQERDRSTSESLLCERGGGGVVFAVKELTAVLRGGEYEVRNHSVG